MSGESVALYILTFYGGVIVGMTMMTIVAKWAVRDGIDKAFQEIRKRDNT